MRRQALCRDAILDYYQHRLEIKGGAHLQIRRPRMLPDTGACEQHLSCSLRARTSRYTGDGTTDALLLYIRPSRGRAAEADGSPTKSRAVNWATPVEFTMRELAEMT